MKRHLVEIKRIFEFAAGHNLPYHKGLCKNVHGHNYKLEVVLRGPIQIKDGPEKGMVMDFGNLKKVVEEVVIKTHDHKDLNTLYGNPTAENMAKDIYDCLEPYFKGYLDHIVLWETSNSCVFYDGETYDDEL